MKSAVDRAVKRVLMVAYHFPPLAGSSGIQRTLRFVQHLPSHGWQPLVLSAHPRAYERTGDDLMGDIPAGTVVRRAFALDTARHLSLRGRYVGALARPDRWVSWKLGAVREGLRMVREFRPDVIWSTYPIATAHLIGAELHRRTGIPWVADFRDPMAQQGYPADPATWQQYKQIEQHAVETASISLFTTPGAAAVYRTRYPHAAHRIGVLENGYDEDSFAEAERDGTSPEPLHPGKVTLLHSGIVYPEERDPTQLFAALRQLKQAGAVDARSFRLRFRAAVHEPMLQRMAAEAGIDDLVETCGPVGYREALREMLRADALLVLQSSGCNEQVPAKAYEYLRARRPVLCLADPVGDTAGVLRDAGVDAIAPLDSADAIAALLPRFVQASRERRAALPTPERVRQASRAGRAEALARRLGELVN